MTPGTDYHSHDRVIALTLPLTIGTAVTSLVFGLLYFGLGVHPYQFIIFISFESIMPPFCTILLYFAYQKPETPSSDGNATSEQARENNRSSKDQRSSKEQLQSNNSELVSSTIIVAPLT